MKSNQVVKIVSMMILLIQIVVLSLAHHEMNAIESLQGSASAQSEMGYMLHYFISMILAILSFSVFVGVVIYLLIKRISMKSYLFLGVTLIIGILLPILFFYFN